MSAALFQLLRRDLGLLLLGGRRGGTMLPLLFFLAVAMLFPFAVGPDPKLLARTGGGVIWVAALLAAILPLDRLIEPDIELGLFDQWALRGIAEEWIVVVRVLAHWLSFGPPLMLAAIPAAALLGIDGETLRAGRAWPAGRNAGAGGAGRHGRSADGWPARRGGAGRAAGDPAGGAAAGVRRGKSRERRRERDRADGGGQPGAAGDGPLCGRGGDKGGAG